MQRLVFRYKNINLFLTIQETSYHRFVDQIKTYSLCHSESFNLSLLLFLFEWKGEAGGRHLVHNQAASSNACIIGRRLYTVQSMLVSISIHRVHTCLLSCHKSKHSTLKVITGRYVIILCSAFGQTNKVGYSLSLLLI